VTHLYINDGSKEERKNWIYMSATGRRRVRCDEIGMTGRQYILHDSDHKKSRMEIHTSLVRTLHARFVFDVIHRVVLHRPLLPRVYVRYLYFLDKNVLRELGQLPAWRKDFL